MSVVIVVAFLEGQISVRNIVGGVEFPAILGGGLMLGLVASFTMLHFSSRGGQLPLSYIAAITVIQTSVALISAMREIPYWSGSIQTLVRIELGFYAVFGVAMSLAWIVRLSPPAIFALAAGCVVVRLVAYTVAWRAESTEGDRSSASLKRRRPCRSSRSRDAVKVWLVKDGENLPIQAGSRKKMRTWMLAERLVARGHSILWWSSTFSHQTRKLLYGRPTSD